MDSNTFLSISKMYGQFNSEDNNFVVVIVINYI